MKDYILQTKTKTFTRLTYTGLVVELEHLKIETTLIDCVDGYEKGAVNSISIFAQIPISDISDAIVVYYKSRKREVKAKLMNESVR